MQFCTLHKGDNKVDTPVKEMVRRAGEQVDVGKVLAGPRPEDPFLALLYDKLEAGVTPEEAIQEFIDEVSRFAEIFLACLDYPPNSITGHELMKKLADRAVVIEEEFSEIPALEAAIAHLYSAKRIGVSNGWFWKQQPPIVITDPDDIDWLCGTGRFAQ